MNKFKKTKKSKHDCSSRQTDSKILHIAPSWRKRLISNRVARQSVSECGECEVGSTCAQLVWQAFPGSYGWVSGNRLASGWSPTPPNSPQFLFLDLWHQLPAKQRDIKESRKIQKQINIKLKKEKVQPVNQNFGQNLKTCEFANWLEKVGKAQIREWLPRIPDGRQDILA